MIREYTRIRNASAPRGFWVKTLREILVIYVLDLVEGQHEIILYKLIFTDSDIVSGSVPVAVLQKHLCSFSVRCHLSCST
jgi:hypothetical protein